MTDQPSITARIDALLSEMTLDEKLAQLGCAWSTALVVDDEFSEDAARRVLAHGIGQVTRIGSSTGLHARERAAFANRIQRFLVEQTRLGIPAIVHEESTAGLCARDATQFPQAIGLASTWNPELLEEVAAVIREEMRATGARHTLAPVLDVARDPRWGRVEETYGESPYLAARLGVAYVRGLQTDDLRAGVAGTGKHFLGYAMSEGGMNHAPVHFGPRELREVYAEPFRAAIAEAGLATVMNAYHSIDGLPCGASAEILDGLLRGELGFEGPVVADYFTTLLLITHHRVAASPGDAGQLALEAGLDMELPQLDCYGAPLKERVESGLLDEAIVDRSVRRALWLKFALGVFDEPYVDESAAGAAYDLASSRAIALDAARESIVLLQNRDALLPLDPATARVAVLGPAADDVRLLQGDYSYPAHTEIIWAVESAGIAPASGGAYSPGPYYPPTTTPLAGIRAAVSSATEVRHEPGCDVLDPATDGIIAAVDAAAGADVAIVCVGGRSGLLENCTSGEFRDSMDLDLPGAQRALVEAVAATGTPTVVVLVGGRVHALPWLVDLVSAIVQAWLPGQEGGEALADVLFGRVAPSGRLPISMPRHPGQIPVHHDHRAGGGRSQMLGDYVDGPTTPLWPFGHGLSYTAFEYSPLRAGADPDTCAPWTVELQVTNAGPVASTEVVQLYLRDEIARVARPDRQLTGFARVPLGPGEIATVRFEIDPSSIAYHDERMRLVIEPGTVRVMAGASAADIRSETVLVVSGPEREIRPSDRRPTTVTVT